MNLEEKVKINLDMNDTDKLKLRQIAFAIQTIVFNVQGKILGFDDFERYLQKNDRAGAINELKRLEAFMREELSHLS